MNKTAARRQLKNVIKTDSDSAYYEPTWNAALQEFEFAAPDLDWNIFPDTPFQRALHKSYACVKARLWVWDQALSEAFAACRCRAWLWWLLTETPATVQLDEYLNEHWYDRSADALKAGIKDVVLTRNGSWRIVFKSPGKKR